MPLENMFKLELTKLELNVVAKALMLAPLPYVDVAPLISRMQELVKPKEPDEPEQTTLEL